MEKATLNFQQQNIISQNFSHLFRNSLYNVHDITSYHYYDDYFANSFSKFAIVPFTF